MLKLLIDNRKIAYSKPKFVNFQSVASLQLVYTASAAGVSLAKRNILTAVFSKFQQLMSPTRISSFAKLPNSAHSNSC